MRINKHPLPPALPLIFLLAAGLVARLLATNIDLMYTNDIYTFQVWAVNLFENGLSGFYGKTFTDYPPVYMYVMYAVGGVRALFDFDFLSPGFNFIIKIPAMLCDLALGFGLYKYASKKPPDIPALLLAAAWLFNPAVILDSAVWGQVDSFYTLTLFAALYLLSDKKYLLAYLAYGAAILTKPQSIFIGPIFLYDAFTWLKAQNFALTAWRTFGVRLLAALGFMLALSLPFAAEGFDLTPVIAQYLGTLGSYSYASVNAYNFFALIGGNWRELNETFLALPYFVWGIVFLLITAAASMFYLFKKKNIWFAAAALNILVFMFSIKMHERYIFPALFFLLLAYVESCSENAFIKNKQVEITKTSRDLRIIVLYAAFSFTFFFNCVDVLRMIAAGNSLDVIANTLPVLSFLNVALAGYTVYVAVTGTGGKADSENNRLTGVADHNALKNVSRNSAAETPADTDRSTPPPMSRRDVVLLLALITVYAFIAFFRLGNTSSPQTVWRPQNNQTSPDSYAMVDFGKEVYIERVRFMMGARHDKPFVMYASRDGVSWTFQYDAKEATVFYWTDVPVNASVRYFEIIPYAEEFMMQEAAFFGANGELLPIPYVNAEAVNLFDEQELVPDRPDYMNGTYFDEIYHARTGYEFANALWPYENTHPPLGKDLIALSIKIFGMTPFGWRFPGTLFGVLMVPLLYFFARSVFRSNNWALFAAFIFTFDFMHFTQTRIATIDTYVTFFVIAMYFFMYRYIQRRSLKTLLACGVCMGLAVASKWQGIYGAVGLPVLFLPDWFKLLKENKREAFKTAGFCFLFFMGIPAVIYALSYIPFAIASGAKDFTGVIRSILINQETMWSYHSNLVSEHSFSSHWWQWPLIFRPIYYYSGEISPEIRQGISSFGNPAVWWVGIIATVYAVRQFIKTKDYTLVFMFVAYAAQYVPWALISRTTYIYHYFPSVPFVVFLIVYMFKTAPQSRKAPLIYAGAVLVLFILFYPVLSGIPVYVSYVNILLKWLPGWVLI